MPQVGFWDDVDALRRLSRLAPYLFIVLGFVIALAGQFVRSRLDSRVKDLQDQAEARRRRTPPQLDAFLATSTKSGDLLVVIDAKNLIPFRANWRIEEVATFRRGCQERVE